MVQGPTHPPMLASVYTHSMFWIYVLEPIGGGVLGCISSVCVWEKVERVRMPNVCVDWNLELAFALNALECMH